MEKVGTNFFTSEVDVNPLSHYFRERKNLPSSYHEHVCFIDHDMGKISVFCKSSIFHDLKESEKVDDIP
jgi:hypothetical protein